MLEQGSLLLPGVVEGGVGQHDPVDARVEQPLVVRRDGQLGLVEQAVEADVELALPAAGDRVAGSDERGLPVTSRRDDLRPTVLGVDRSEVPQQGRVVDLLDGRVAPGSQRSHRAPATTARTG